MDQNGDIIINMERILTSLQEKTVDGLCLEPQSQFSIYRVPMHIRKNNESYYEPRMVSIGPYHRNKEQLCAMEDHKWRYLNEFIKKKDGILHRCLREMTDLEAKSRESYFENVHLNSYHFVEMMILDSCFIIQLFIKWHYDEKDAPLHVGWASPLLISDLLMLENQIPFFVLTKMYEIYTDVHDSPPIDPNSHSLRKKWPSFITLVKDTLRFRHVIHEINNEGQSKDLETSVPKHLLDCFYRIILHSQTNALMGVERAPIPKPVSGEERSISMGARPKRILNLFNGLFRRRQINIEQNESSQHTSRSTNAKIINCDQSFCGSKKCSKKRISPIVIPSAIELQEFGVTLRRKKSTSFLDISFKGGTLEVPRFTIEESNRSRILNLIAFEQCNDVDVYPIRKPLSSYAAFMACLMNISEDVLVVERAGIIENNLANSEEGAKFFHQLREFAHIEVDNHYLKQVFVEVNDHCHAFWPKHKARLRRDYFSSPWTIFSLGAALLVLSITIFRILCYILIHFTHNLR